MAEKDWKAVVPEKFYKCGKHPKARTVGQLVKLLNELPPTMKVCAPFGDPAEVVVFNINKSPFVTICDQQR